jgi:hypothetical protein
MAVYPYTSSRGSIVKAVEQFRKNFPAAVDAATLQKFSIAPANESYVINTFRFLGLIDEDGKKVAGKTDFFLHGDAEFHNGMEAVLRDAYADLFRDQGDSPWDEPRERLATWFRVTDKTSDLIGDRQATTFLTLCALAGHGDVAVPPPSTSTSTSKNPTSKAPRAPKASGSNASKPAENAQPAAPVHVDPIIAAPAVGLTVRVEVNLPADGSPEAYDAIFASIRKHLIDQ